MRCEPLPTGVRCRRKRAPTCRPRSSRCCTSGNDMASSPIDTLVRPPPGLPREARLESLADIKRAYDDVIALAQRHVKVFDRDLSSGGWNSPERCSALSSYLRRKPGARLDIIVHETRYVE